MARLQESQRKFYDTQAFCKCYTYEGHPINPSVQMDTEEFYNMLFDKLETTAKSFQIPHAAIFQKYFGGKLCNQIISKECQHVSETEESFLDLGLSIKGKKNIIDSLELFVEGDPLEGENKYDCSQCQKKVDARKRACLKELPDNLIICNKRFEFDMDYFKRVKLNDYVEFPMELDLTKYTKEYLEKQEGRSDAVLKDTSHYKYNLVGILCHVGSADTGHYYSFIKDRLSRQWYEFNDIRIEQFDIKVRVFSSPFIFFIFIHFLDLHHKKTIPSKCFGGWETLSQWDSNLKKHTPQVVQKSDNAYLLFYERIQFEKAFPEEPIKNLASAVSKELFENIWNDNLSFLKEKQTFHPIYFDFILNLISKCVSQQPQEPVLGFHIFFLSFKKCKMQQSNYLCLL